MLKSAWPRNSVFKGKFNELTPGSGDLFPITTLRVEEIDEAEKRLKSLKVPRDAPPRVKKGLIKAMFIMLKLTRLLATDPVICLLETTL